MDIFYYPIRPAFYLKYLPCSMICLLCFYFCCLQWAGFPTVIHKWMQNVSNQWESTVLITRVGHLFKQLEIFSPLFSPADIYFVYLWSLYFFIFFSLILQNTVVGQQRSSVATMEEVKRNGDTVMKVQSLQDHAYMKLNKRSVFSEKVTQWRRTKTKQNSQILHSLLSHMLMLW